MTLRLDAYFSRLLLSRFGVLMLTLASILLLNEFLGAGNKLVELGDWAVPRFLMLRLPEVFANLVPFTVLMASLLTLVTLARNSELVSFRAAGISQWRMMVAMLPGAVAIALVQLVLIEFVVPPANEALRRIGVGDFDFDRGDSGLAEIWVRLDSDVVRFRTDPAAQDERVYDVLIYNRDAQGRVVSQLTAPIADVGPQSWRLHEARLTPAGGGVPTQQKFVDWDIDLPPDLLERLTRHPRDLSISDLHGLADRDSLGNRPQYLYDLWLAKKLILPVTTVLLVLAMVPLVQGFDRARGSFFALVAGIATGLVFISIDGLFVAIGESGLLPPLLAASLATLILVTGIGIIAFNRE